MVGVVSSSLYRRTHSLSRLGAILHSSNESGELSQWLYHDDSTINIVLDIIIITIITVDCCSTWSVANPGFFNEARKHEVGGAVAAEMP